jgi:hypothetical protein
VPFRHYLPDKKPNGGPIYATHSPFTVFLLSALLIANVAVAADSNERGLGQMDAPTSSMIVYSTAHGSVAADGDGRNRTFTEQLLASMGTPNLDVELSCARRSTRPPAANRCHELRHPPRIVCLQPDPDLKSDQRVNFLKLNQKMNWHFLGFSSCPSW